MKLKNKNCHSEEPQRIKPNVNMAATEESQPYKTHIRYREGVPMKKIKTKISIWAFILRAGIIICGPFLTISMIVAMIIKGFSIDVFVFCIGTLIVTIVLYCCIIIQTVHFDIKKQKVKVRHMRWDYNCEIPFAQIAYIEARWGNIIFTYKSGGKKEILLFRPWMTISGKKVIESWNEYLKENTNKKQLVSIENPQ